MSPKAAPTVRKGICAVRALPLFQLVIRNQELKLKKNNYVTERSESLKTCAGSRQAVWGKSSVANTRTELRNNYIMKEKKENGTFS